MTQRLRSLAPLLLISLVAIPAAAQKKAGAPDPNKTATVRHLLNLIKAPELAQHSFESLIPAQKAANPNVPPAFWDAFAARLHTELPHLIDSLVPIYASRFTQTELNELVKFYSSPIGRRLTELQPVMMEESQAVGQRWGMALGRQIGDSLRKAGAAGPQ
jgi:hypothetical protein